MAGKRRHWKEKDGRFWARIAIPMALRPFFDNKTQLTEALGGDLKAADHKHAAAVARLQEQLENARRVISSGDRELVEEPGHLPLSDEDIQRAAWEHYQSELARIEQKRASMPSATELQHELSKITERLEAEAGLPERGIAETFNVYTDYELKAGARHFDRNLRSRHLVALRAALADGDTRFVDTAVQKFVDLSGLGHEPGSRDWQMLSTGFIRAEIEALSRSIEVDRGALGGVPKDPLIKPPAPDKPKLERVRSPVWQQRSAGPGTRHSEVRMKGRTMPGRRRSFLPPSVAASGPSRLRRAS